MAVTRIPKVVQNYIAEYEETEQSARDYILRQLEYYDTIADKGQSSSSQWLGFKLGCSASAAAYAIRWANQ